MESTIIFMVLLLGTGVKCQNELKPDIYYLHINSAIQYRFATTLVTSRIANPADVADEVAFNFNLPNSAFISNFTLELEGKVYPGIVKGKEVAKKEYQVAQSQGQNAGIISQSPRETNSFNLRVNVAAGSKVTFNLTYQELLQRRLGVYQHKIYVNPGQPVDDLQILVSIEESRDITTLRVPPIQVDSLLTNDVKNEVNLNALITRGTGMAQILYEATVEEQTEASEQGLLGHFIVEYDVDRAVDAGDVLVVDGYFVHYIAPPIKTAIPKDVLFVLDKSGSMDGKKMTQLKAAMYHILSDLRALDRFNIITFDSEISTFYQNYLDVNDDNLVMTKTKIRNIKARGDTNIHASVLAGVQSLRQTASNRSQIIVFLTDGDATSGITSSRRIMEDVREANVKGIPINTLAFGSRANWNLLKKLAIQNNGIARRIYEDSDSDLQITGFYAEISDSLLKEIQVTYLDVDKSSLTTTEFSRYYNGTELVVCGQLTEDTIQGSIKASGAGGNIVLVLEQDEVIYETLPAPLENNVFQNIMEKIWAYLTIKDYFKDIDSGLLTVTDKEMLTKKALNMSLKYNFVTRLTSMVVTIPDQNNIFSQKSSKDMQMELDKMNAPGSAGIQTNIHKTHKSSVGNTRKNNFKMSSGINNKMAGTHWSFPEHSVRDIGDMEMELDTRNVSGSVGIQNNVHNTHKSSVGDTRKHNKMYRGRYHNTNLRRMHIPGPTSDVDDHAVNNDSIGGAENLSTKVTMWVTFLFLLIKLHCFSF